MGHEQLCSLCWWDAAASQHALLPSPELTLSWCADEKAGRQLLQATSNPISNFTLSVMVTKCSGTQTVDQASVAALVNGYTATNLKIPLSPTRSNPSLYSGEPDLAACVSCAVICFCHAQGERCSRRSPNPKTSLAMPALL